MAEELSLVGDNTPEMEGGERTDGLGVEARLSGIPYNSVAGAESGVLEAGGDVIVTVGVVTFSLDERLAASDGGSTVVTLERVLFLGTRVKTSPTLSCLSAGSPLGDGDLVKDREGMRVAGSEGEVDSD